MALVAVTVVTSGCSPGVEADRAAAHDAPKVEMPGPVEPEHDFGRLLARGQTLRHDFTLVNPTDRPIALLGGRAFTPCCSEIGPLSGSIPPGGSVAVPVVFKPGHQAGRKRVEFAIRTDFARRPMWSLAVVASLVPDMAVRRAEESEAALLVGQSGRQILSVVCRRRGDEGRTAPESLEATPPLSAAFTGPAREAEGPDGLIEATRDVEVILPDSADPGPKRGSVRFLWGEGEPVDYPVAWDVAPCIRATPSGLVLRPRNAGESHTVLLRSADRAFRIVDVTGPIAEGGSRGWSDEPKRVHQVALRLNAARLEMAGAADITIATDHPDQPAVVVSVLVVPDGAEGETE